MGQGYNIGFGPMPASHIVPGFEGRPAGQIRHPSFKILALDWGRPEDGQGGCNSGPPYQNQLGDELSPPGMLAGGATSYWTVVRVHHGGSNLLFGDGSVRMREPEAFHSNADGTGIAQGLDGADLEISDRWRRYWDTSYGGN